MTLSLHLPIIVFLFLFGSCVGSFLNVVIWRLPRDESLVLPGSHCPHCNTQLQWYDNIPIFGWIALRGRCRYCNALISARYPIVEALTAGMFVLYYVLFYLTPPTWQIGFCGASPIARSFLSTWPTFLLYLYLLSALLAASLIDAELFIIPPQIIWSWKGGVAIVAVLVHALVDRPHLPGSLCATPLPAALAAGGALGLLLSLLLLRLGMLPLSFSEGGPLLEIEKAQHAREVDAAAALGSEQPPAFREYSSSEIRAEIRKEMLFLMPPLFCAFVFLFLTWRGGPLYRQWNQLLQIHWISALLGSVLGGLVGGFVVWFTRIAGSMFFGREAMGMGDVDLLAGVGAVLGAGAATVAFFLAPLFGLTFAVYLWAGGKRELPYGPYLSLASAVVMLFYCPIAGYLAPLGYVVTMVQQIIWGHG